MARCEWVGWCPRGRDHRMVLRTRAGEDRLAVCTEHLAAAEAYGYVPDDVTDPAPPDVPGTPGTPADPGGPSGTASSPPPARS